ncbi:MAG: hypothetical protein FJ121_02360 [Deltaproteobacteria bacterium]|nr:hypothetical protein [Deltaproteobacteria bacterium]
MGDPQKILEEVTKIVRLMYPAANFNPVQDVFKDVVKLFRGEYPGYRACNTWYHNLRHTTDCLLAMARLIHGGFIQGMVMEARDVALGLIAALLHDTGYIQTAEDDYGTGAKYTMVHVERSIEFMKIYFAQHGYASEDFLFCSKCLECTGLEVKIGELAFISRHHETLGQMLGTADLLGQMADRTYLERLPFLYHEFKEGGVQGFADELDLLQKTPAFWEFTQKRLAGELGGVDRFMRGHFRVRWGIDLDMGREAVEKNIAYLQFILANHGDDYQRYLRRDGLIQIFQEMRRQQGSGEF